MASKSIDKVGKILQMGQAKQRGTREERIAAAMSRNPDMDKIRRRSVLSNRDADVEFATIPRSHVENRAPQAFIALLNSFVTSKEVANKKAQSLIVAFDGYDDDSREIFTVPEVRQYIYDVVQACPWWLHLLRPDSYLVWFASITTIVHCAKTATDQLQLVLDTQQLRNFAHASFAEIGKLHQSLSLTTFESGTILENVAQSLRTFSQNLSGAVKASPQAA